MSSLQVKVKRVRHDVDVPLPRYQSAEAAGMDLHAALTAAVVIEPGQRALIPTGFAFQLPVGFEGQLRPRSGLALRHGITIANSPGTLDSDYRGEVGIVLINHGDASFTVEPLMRIGQMIIARHERAELELVSELSSSDRGAGGYGSTGKQ